MDRALRALSGNDERPRAFILRLHYVHEMEEIMQKAAVMVLKSDEVRTQVARENFLFFY